MFVVVFVFSVCCFFQVSVFDVLGFPFLVFVLFAVSVFAVVQCYWVAVFSGFCVCCFLCFQCLLICSVACV